MFAEFGGYPGKRRARHLGGDGGNTCLMPANAGVNDSRTRRFDGFA